MESTLGESCPPGQRGGPAARGEDRAPFPDHQSFHTSIIPTGDENGNPPGRYRPAWCGSPNATGWLLIDRGLRSQRAARIFPRANVEIPPHPGRPWSGPRIINPSKISTTDNSGTKTEIPRVDTASHGVETQPRWLVADWLGLMEPARAEICPSGQSRGPVLRGKDEVSCPDGKSFHNSTPPTARTKTEIPRVDTARAAWKPQSPLAVS